MFQNFTKAQLTEILVAIGRETEKPLRAYVFGGAVMVQDGLKILTKDIDLLVETPQEYQAFLRAAKKAGFIEQTRIPKAYARFHLSAILQNPAKKWRVDLFTKVVCGKMELTADMKRRATPFAAHGKLEVKRLAYEDIMLLKAVADRPHDHEDMEAIFLHKHQNQRVLEGEMLAQIDHLTYILPTLEEFAAKRKLDFRFSRKALQAFEERQKEELDGWEKRLKAAKSGRGN